MCHYMTRHFTILILFFASFSPSLAQINNTPVFDTKTSSVATLFSAKKYTEALKLVNRLIADNPESGVNYFSKAVINYFNGNSTTHADTSIIKDCNRAIDLNYDNPEVNYLLFLIYFRNIDHFKEGFLSYTSGSTLFEEIKIDFQITKEQIDIAINKKSTNEKYLAARIQLLQKIFNQDGFESEITQQDFATFKSDCDYILLIAKVKENKANAYYQLSQIELYKNHDTLRAIRYITNSLEALPTNLKLYYQRADLKKELQNYQGAISDYSSYLSKKKNADNYNDAAIYRDRGECYYELDKYSLAITDFTQAIAMFEKEKTITQNKSNTFSEGKISAINGYLKLLYFNRGLSYSMLKNNTKACVDFNKAVDYGSTKAVDIIKEFCK